MKTNHHQITKLVAGTVLAAGLGFGALVSQSMAQSNPLANEIITGAGKPVANFDVQNVIPILQEMGLSIEGRTDDSGNKLLLAQASSGLRFALIPVACQNGANSGCVGMNMLALFPQAPQRDVNSFNYRYAFVSAGVHPTNSTSYVSRYMIADYGIPKGNIASNIYNFIALAEQFSKVVNDARQTVSLESDPDDLAAYSLNLAAAQADPMANMMLGETISIHQVGMEKTADQVAMLARADKADPGKIINFTLDKKAP